jgi:hypothetical protein
MTIFYTEYEKAFLASRQQRERERLVALNSSNSGGLVPMEPGYYYNSSMAPDCPTSSDSGSCDSGGGGDGGGGGGE